MQIRSLFLVCMSVVAALGACLGGWVLTQMVLEYRLAGRVERAVEIDRLLFIASDKLANERPVTGNALLGELPPDPETRARLAAVRQEADDALQKLETRIASRRYEGSAPQLVIVQENRRNLALWRKVVDVALEQPKSLRQPAIFAQYFEGVNAVFESTSVVLDMGDLAAALHDGTSVELIALSRLVWAARSTMGLRTVPLIAAIDTGIALDSPKLEAQARYDGMIAATWPPIAAIGRRLTGMPAINAAVARGREAFEAYDRLCQDVIAASRENRPYPVSALDLGRAATRTAPVLLAIRDEALAAARDRVVQNRETAAIYVMVAGVILALTMFAMIFVLMLLQHRIVSPMLALTDVIGRIARLEFDVPIPARDRADEIGRMALALDALRSGAMAGEANKAQLIHLARHDALTGLSNRVTLQEKLDQAVEMAGRGIHSAALCLDLDRFKEVNDTFGHPTGDRLLKAVADRLLACVREVDTVSRLGGDEFVVLLLAIDGPEDAALVAGRIVQALNKPFDLDGQAVGVGVSVGIALAPQDANAGVDLLKRADTALYRAKSEEKGSWRFFRPEMDTHLQERLALERDLRDAVRDNAFSLVYQPQFRLASGSDGIDRLCGFEALLRWRHPRRGMVSPAVFIPLAEETGLIEAIGAWVLDQACVEAASWPDTVKLAVNMSGVQFRSLDVLQTVRDALARSGLPAHRLELEITETVLLNNTAHNTSILHAFHDMGIHVAMDDFGTGYSSLSYLRGFPFDAIKIDRSFVHDLCEDNGSREIVHAIVALADSLGMTTTAEGVETPEHLAELRRQGCTDVQGFLLGRPLPAADAMRLLSRETTPDTAVA